MKATCVERACFFSWTCVLGAALAGWADLPKAIETEPGALGPKMGHVQGMDAMDSAIYLSHDRGLVKLDWTGKVVKVVSAPCHTGDICIWKDHVFTATHVVEPDYGLIEVYDSDLCLVRSRRFDFCIDGITCVEGLLYVGFGRYHSRPMRGHLIGFVDAETLEPRKACGVDYGAETCFGPQDLAYDGTNVWMMFYPKRGQPGCGRFSKDLSSSETVDVAFSNGFCLAPRRFWTDDEPVYMNCKMLKNEKGPGVRLAFWHFRNGRFVGN